MNNPVEKPCAVCGTPTTGQVEEVPVCLECYENRSTDVLAKIAELECGYEDNDQTYHGE
jgi:hypothetical protein